MWQNNSAGAIKFSQYPRLKFEFEHDPNLIYKVIAGPEAISVKALKKAHMDSLIEGTSMFLLRAAVLERTACMLAAIQLLEHLSIAVTL